MGKRITLGLIFLVIFGSFLINYNSSQLVTSFEKVSDDYTTESDAIFIEDVWVMNDYILNSAPHSADFNGDGYYDILFASGLELYCLSGFDGKQIWKQSEASAYISTPAIADIDNDSRLEVIIQGNELSGANVIYIYDHEGNDERTLTSPPVYGSYPYHTSTPCVADLDFDGYYEILIGTRYGIVCYDTEDYSRWEYDTPNEVYSSPSILNADADDNYEIVFTCSDNYTYCLENNGDLKWKQHFVGTDTASAMSSPVCYDIDGDGKHEIFVGQGKRFCGYAPNGTLLWSYATTEEYEWFEGTAAIANLDDNGPVEILVHSSYGYLYCFSEKGQLNWTYEGISVNLEQTTPIIADIDGDDWQEIIIVGNDLVCLSKNGIEIFRHMG